MGGGKFNLEKKDYEVVLIRYFYLNDFFWIRIYFII